MIREVSHVCTFAINHFGIQLSKKRHQVQIFSQIFLHQVGYQTFPLMKGYFREKSKSHIKNPISPTTKSTNLGWMDSI